MFASFVGHFWFRLVFSFVEFLVLTLTYSLKPSFLVSLVFDAFSFFDACLFVNRFLA
jgi:hypothetical protein